MAPVVIAAVQAKPRSSSLSQMRDGGDVAHAVELLDEARRQGADLACFPEMYPLAGEHVLQQTAARLRLWVVAGLEEPAAGATTYNTATFINRQGEVVARQRKVFPTERELERGIVPGTGYEVVQTELGRFGAVICSDFAFSSEGVRSLERQGVEILLSPSWWFALAEGFPAVILARHFELGIPIVGVNVAKVAMTVGDGTSAADQLPPAGGYTTVTSPPSVASLDDLGTWFRDKPAGINAVGDVCRSLGEAEGMLLVSVDLEASRAFPGYFYSAAARDLRRREIGR